MAISQSTTETGYRCQECGGELHAPYDSLECTECGYTPRHGAD
ncbi:hypothetical protein [Halopiger goleimassiliensis]|nr:hypothetical protein [Halopiger goleimassiliensis]